MTAPLGAAELRTRLGLVRRVLARTPEPLHVPLGIAFAPTSGERHLEAWARFAARARAGAVHPTATLYVHIPFCARLCTYCLLSASRTPGKAATDAYVRAVLRQIEIFEPVVRGLRFASLHVGGGTPSLLAEDQLDALLSALGRFERTEGFQIGIEAHPGTATAAKMRLFARHGVDRVSFGVESFTPAVLRDVNREDQTEERVRAAVAAARQAGLSVNVDMLAGLPAETAETFELSMRKALELEPDSMSVNRFLAESSPLAHMGYGPDEEENRRADRMLLAADALVRAEGGPRWPERPLELPGFGTQYVWDRSSKARRYFQDDMIGPASTLALGHGSLGHIHGESFSVAAGTHLDFVEALASGRPPAMLESVLSTRFEMAFYAADRACRGDLSLARFAEIFGESAAKVFGRELAFLVSSDLLRVEADRIAKPASTAFQVSHLLAFLLKRSDQLARDLERLSAGDAALAGHPARERQGHVARAVGGGEPGSPVAPRAGGAPSAPVDLVASPDDDAVALAAAVRAARAEGASGVALWAPLGRPIDEALAARLSGAGADEIVVVSDEAGALPTGSDRLASASLTTLVRVPRGVAAAVLLGPSARAGARRVLVDAAEGLSSEQAAALWAAGESLGLQLELEGNGRPELAQYAAVRAELPPSLLWCRIAMRAAAAARGAQRLAVLAEVRQRSPSTPD